MSTAIAGKKLSTKPAEPDDRQRARQSKRHPDCRSTTIKLTAHANIACVIVGAGQPSLPRDPRNGHPDFLCVPIQIVALHGGAQAKLSTPQRRASVRMLQSIHGYIRSGSYGC